MGAEPRTLQHWVDRLLVPAEERLALRFCEQSIEVRSNCRDLLAYLAGYFEEFQGDPADHPDLAIVALEAPPTDLGLTYTVKPPDPGKDRIKEEFVDLPDGRIVRKRLTGMLFLFGGDLHLAYGPCLENANQVVNFINNRFLQYHLNRGSLLAHAAGVAVGERGLALAGFSGAGKSTLALHLLSRGATFVSNDRLLVSASGTERRMLGVPKLPRVNPGTILHNEALRDVMPPAERAAAAALPADELWQLEQKYDVFIQRCIGPGRFQLQAPLRALCMLTWQRDGGAPRLAPADLATRPDLLDAFRKPVGLFYEDEGLEERPDFTPAAYLEAMGDAPVFELSGGVDFDRAASWCLHFLETGAMPEVTG
jgi:HprK-related kinase B